MDNRDLLIKARDEIRSLRRANEVLSAKVEVMDLFACVLHTTPATRGHGMGEDIAWALQTKIDALAENAQTPADAEDESYIRYGGYQRLNVAASGKLEEGE